MQRRRSAAARDCGTSAYGAPADDERLLTLIGDARFVLLGEARTVRHECYLEPSRSLGTPQAARFHPLWPSRRIWPDAYRRMSRGHHAVPPYVLLLLCLGEQYRPAVETPETRGLSV